jgi:hypothetical protein
MGPLVNGVIAGMLGIGGNCGVFSMVWCLLEKGIIDLVLEDQILGYQYVRVS